MNDAERGELFRAYVNRPSNHDGESHVTKLLDRCQKAEAEVERLRALLGEFADFAEDSSWTNLAAESNGRKAADLAPFEVMLKPNRPARPIWRGMEWGCPRCRSKFNTIEDFEAHECRRSCRPGRL